MMHATTNDSNTNTMPVLNCSVPLDDVAASDTMAALHKLARKSEPKRVYDSDLLKEFAESHDLTIVDDMICGTKGGISLHHFYGLVLTMPAKHCSDKLAELGTLVKVTSSKAVVQFDRRNAKRVLTTAGIHAKSRDMNDAQIANLQAKSKKKVLPYMDLEKARTLVS
jgi:tRNA isopentenyl-2-thiomethyl-A-37 hydroxylase MiaE